MECGADYDPAELDQVIYHNTGRHTLREATGIIGVRQLGMNPAHGAPYGQPLLVVHDTVLVNLTKDGEPLKGE